ncbi:MAG: glycosyltransferase family 4 protein [Thermoplasmata archaeon]
MELCRVNQGIHRGLKVMMKIAVLGWELPPAFAGGLGIHTINLFTIISKIMEVNLYVPDAPGLLSKYPFQVTRINISPGDSNYGKSNDFYESVIKYNDLITTQFENDISIIHAHDWITFRAGVKLKKMTGKPLVVTVHSTEYDRSGNFNPQRRIMDIEEEGIREADRVIAVSNYTKKIIQEVYGIDNSKIEVIYNGVSSSIYSNMEKNYDNTKRVLYFGRVTPQKGPKFFVEAARKVLTRRKDVIFVVSGTGDQLDEMKNSVRTLGMENNFEFTGFVSEGYSLKIYRDSDVFVLPAVSEPFGMTVLESMSTGTPTVISKTTGVGEALSNVLRCDFWDTDKMADYILAILNFRPLREMMGKRGRIEAMNFTWDKAAIKTMGVYNSI